MNAAVPAKSASRKTATRKAAQRKSPVRPTAVTTATAAAKPAKKAAPAQAVKAPKPKKPKLVRDSFSIPKTEYAVLEALKQRALRAGGPGKKSEVLRAGIKALADLSDTAFAAAMRAVPTIKTGRPAGA